jgi:hypothetical protein
MGIELLIGAAGAVAGGALSAKGARDAAKTQAGATDAAVQEQRRQFDLNREDALQTRADFAPYREAGTNALTTLQGDINTPVSAAEVMSDPGYQFGMQQGQQGLDRKFAAMGGRASGAALKAATRYATDYAASGYGAAYQRKQDRLNRLAAIAGIGQTSTGQSGMNGAGSSQSSAISNLISAQGNAAGASQMAQGNIWGNTINQLGAIGQRWANQPTTPNAGFGPTGGYTYSDGALFEGPG